MNIDYIKNISSEMFRILNENTLDPRIQSIEPLVTRSGEPNLKITSKSMVCTLHSGYAPKEEAKKLVAHYSHTKRKMFVVFGIGLGYHIEELLERYPDEEILVLEPTYSILKFATRLRDFRFLFKNSRLKLMISEDTRELWEMLCSAYHFHKYDGIEIFELPSYSRFFREELNIVRKKFVQALSKYTINAITVMETGKSFSTNSLRNLKHLPHFPQAGKLFNRFEKIPAIIISAGPSLHLHLKSLENLKNKAVLIAVDTAWPILNKAGIEPHFICSADPSVGNFIHLKSCPPKNSVLVVEPMTYPEILDLENVKAFFTSFSGYYAQYYSRFTDCDSSLLSWGSIASTCFDLSRKMGCDPIVFVGQDFSYSDFLSHCPGSNFDTVWEEQFENQPIKSLYTSYMSFQIGRVFDKSLYQTEDLYGQPTFTQRNMTEYVKWFSDQFAQSHQTIINASEKGILRENCQISTFSEVIKTKIRQTFDIEKRIQECYQVSGFNFSALKEDMQKKILQLENAVLVARENQNRTKELSSLVFDPNSQEDKIRIGTCFNQISLNSDCQISDPELRLWVDHENHKAEMYFKRKISAHVGNFLDTDLVAHTAELYYNLFESKIYHFLRLADLLRISLEEAEKNI